MQNHKPLIAVTQGDPAGIGPEIIVGAWSETVVHDYCRPVVVGHPEVMCRAVDLWQTGVAVVDHRLAPRADDDFRPEMPAGSPWVTAISGLWFCMAADHRINRWGRHSCLPLGRQKCLPPPRA